MHVGGEGGWAFRSSFLVVFGLVLGSVSMNGTERNDGVKKVGHEFKFQGVSSGLSIVMLVLGGADNLPTLADIFRCIFSHPPWPALEHEPGSWDEKWLFQVCLDEPSLKDQVTTSLSGPTVPPLTVELED
ncbi:hypothetical protein BYT27DRAFT_7212615 [Phlegmacium glaucopus]|nr:hypothetical protein BYT27DRAFT_7212615 [Phlegmacium glaucopus]